MKYFISGFVGLIIAAAGLGLVTQSASAINVFGDGCRGANRSSAVCEEVNEGRSSANSLIRDVTNTLLYVVGVIAVIMIIVGGIRYTLSNGDSNKVTQAKNTILYSVVGLVVAILAFAIVNFVLVRFGF